MDPATLLFIASTGKSIFGFLNTRSANKQYLQAKIDREIANMQYLHAIINLEITPPTRIGSNRLRIMRRL